MTNNGEQLDQLISQVEKVSKWIEIMMDRADDITLAYIKDCAKEAFQSGN